MILKDTRGFLAVVLSFVLASASSRFVYGYQEPASGADTGGGTEAAPMSAAELQA
jgi:hypothetical protein